MLREKLLEWADVFLKSFLILCVLYIFFWPFRIDGASMEESFLNNDRIAVSRIMAFVNLIDYGDCVVCQIDERGEKEKIIKRVVGKPSDNIRIEDGLVYRNGVAIDEPYITSLTSGNLEITLGDDEYFILGDNRSISYDSRSMGPVSKNKIIGRVIVKWYPFTDFRIY